MFEKNEKDGAEFNNNSAQNNTKEFKSKLNVLFLETLKKEGFPIELITGMDMNKKL